MAIQFFQWHRIGRRYRYGDQNDFKTALLFLVPPASIFLVTPEYIL
jgi:hypothetical protein